MSNARELSQLAPLVTVDANNKITFASTSEVEFGGLVFPTADGTNGQVLTTDGAGNLTFTTASGGGGTGLAVLSTKLVGSPTPVGYGSFGGSVSVSGNYAIVGAKGEGSTNAGKAHIFDTETGSLLHTLDNPNAYGTSDNDQFANSVAISGNYAIVGASSEDDAGGTESGKAYIFDVITGLLVHTLDNPNAYDTSASDQFGGSVAISGNYAIVGAHAEDDAGGTFSGKAYIYNVTTGALLYTLDNPTAFSTSQSDTFAKRVDISGNYVIVGAPFEQDENINGGFAAGKAYIYDISTFTTSTISSANYVLDNPNPFGTSDGDYFGDSVAISGNYAIVGAMDNTGFGGEDDAGGTTSGKAYIYDISTFTTSTISSANYVLDNPNAYDTSASDRFGHTVSISGNYAVVGAPGEKDATTAFTSFGITYIYDISTFTTSTISSANLVIDNPNSYDDDPNNSDFFGHSVAVSGSNLIVGAIGESDVSNAGVPVGVSYIFKTNIQPYDYSGPEIASFAPASGGGGGISNIVEDTTPQLGGDLDVNDKLIYNDTGTVKLQAGSADYVTIVNSSDVDKIRFSDIGGIAALGWYHQFGDSSSARGVVNLMGSTSGVSGTGALRIHDNDSSAHVELTVPTTVSANVSFTLPGADGSNNQVLTTDGSGNLSFTTISGGISNVVEDTTPQLGGNLDLNSNYIGHANAYMKAYDFGTGSSFEVAMQGYTSLSLYANPGSNTANVTISDDLIVQGGDITLGGTGRIQGIDTVSANTDATNKLYVDNAVAGAGGIADIVEDTTPQLGGNLDTVGNTITSSSANLFLSGSTQTGGQNTQTGYVWIQGADGTSSQSGTVYIQGVSGGSLDPADVGNVYINYQGNNGQPFGTTYIGTTNGLNGGFYDNEVQIRGLWWPDADGTSGQALTTDGSGNLSWSTFNTVIGTDTDINTSGSTIIDNIFVTDGVITSMGTRTLTASDIGALSTSVANQNLNTNSGPTFNNLTVSTSMVLADNIIHSGDSNTYFGFHAADQWRVVTGGTERFEVNSSNVTVQNDLIVNGGDITLGGTGRIQGIDTVSANTDAANKLYVDNAVSGVGGGISNVVEDTSPQLGGNLDLNGNYIGDSTAYLEAYDFSTGSQFAVYMQGELSAALSIYANAGSSIANVSIKDDLTVSGGDITLGGTGRIQGIDTVSADTDAANKLYVDNAVAGAGGGGGFAQSYMNNQVFN